MENQRWFDLLRFSTTMPSVNAESSYEKITFVMAPYYSQFDTPSTTAQLQAKVDDPNLIYHRFQMLKS
jgi:hypothetical protein